MALNLSKKIENMSEDGHSGGDGSESINGEDPNNPGMMTSEMFMSNSAAGSASFQPLDLSLKGPSNNNNNQNHNSQQYRTQLAPPQIIGNLNGRKRLLQWSNMILDQHQQTSSSHNYEGVILEPNNNGDNNRGGESSDTIVVVDDDGDSGTALQLLEDNPNENGAYACHFCNSPPSSPVIFQTWAAVQAHFQSCHPNERPFACPFAPDCPYSTKWFCDMRIHFRRHHPDIANSPRQLYDAIQLVKDRTTMPSMLLPNGHHHNQQSPASSSSPPSTDSLLMIASKLPLLMNGSTSSASHSTSSSTFYNNSNNNNNNNHHHHQNRHHQNNNNNSKHQNQPINSVVINNNNNNNNQPMLGNGGVKKPPILQSFNPHESAFWAKAVGQQQSKGDIRSVKAIKIDCRSVHKALSNHRHQQQQQQQQQQQMAQSSPLRSIGHALNSASSTSATNFQGNKGAGNGVHHDMLNNGNQRIPYKFQCPLCNYRTQRQTNFECHVACHENLRIYKCSACAYRSNWKWDLKKHIRQVHPIDVDGERRQQPAEKIFIGKMDDGDSLDGGDNGGGGVEGGAAKILVMPLEEARRTVDTYLKQVGKSAEKFLLKCVLCPFVTKRRKLLTRHHQQTHGLRPEECCATDDFVVALPSSPESNLGDQAAGDEALS